MFFLAVALWIQAQASQQLDSSMGQTQDSASIADASVQDSSIVQQVKVQVTAPPETATVGQHFAVAVHVHLPANLAALLTFPYGPDSTQDSVTTASSVRHQDSTWGGFVDATATYILSAWYTGQINIRLGYLVIAGTRIRIPDNSIMVRSVLPTDSTALAKVRPKDPRSFIGVSIIKRIFQDARVWILCGILLLLVALAGFFWWRSRRNKDMPKPAGDWVEREFRRIEAMRLLEKGEPEQYAICMSTVVRQFLIRTFATMRESATTRELAITLSGEPLVPTERSLALFERVDLLKFAHTGIQDSEAQYTGNESRAIVREILERHQND